MWQSWINAILGLWVIAVPFTGMAGTTMMWTLVVTGAGMAILSLWSGLEMGSEREEGRAFSHA